MLKFQEGDARDDRSWLANERDDNLKLGDNRPEILCMFEAILKAQNSNLTKCRRFRPGRHCKYTVGSIGFRGSRRLSSFVELSAVPVHPSCLVSNIPLTRHLPNLGLKIGLRLSRVERQSQKFRELTGDRTRTCGLMLEANLVLTAKRA